MDYENRMYSGRARVILVLHYNTLTPDRFADVNAFLSRLEADASWSYKGYLL